MIRDKAVKQQTPTEPSVNDEPFIKEESVFFEVCVTSVSIDSVLCGKLKAAAVRVIACWAPGGLVWPEKRRMAAAHGIPAS